ncbi:hypothetical protein K438DRAFT_1973596 [Mycena galopus ATCC 62051]|nr:hypothetical protein K438DRAFT_1973596 [Mycena galopus ATCC 62051]
MIDDLLMLSRKQAGSVRHRNDVEGVAKKIVAPAKRRLTTWKLTQHIHGRGANRVDCRAWASSHRHAAGNLLALMLILGLCSYGTPFLLNLGLSVEQLTSLLWLPGPISGPIAQPVIVVSTLILAYCQEVAGLVVDIFGVGEGDREEKRKGWAKATAIGFAVFAFYVLDFALNALQASLRNLLLDITPAYHVHVLHNHSQAGVWLDVRFICNPEETSQATVFITLIGICWSVAMWAPFAIIMELLKDLSTILPSASQPAHIRTLSVPVAGPRRGSNIRPDERQPLIHRRSYDAFDPTGEDVHPAARSGWYNSECSHPRHRGSSADRCPCDEHNI